jgi:hypothetical protein
LIAAFAGPRTWPAAGSMVTILSSRPRNRQQANQNEESINTLSHGRVIGIDVSHDWLDLYCLPDGRRRRVPNAPEGHTAVADLARERNAIVCFGSTWGQEWQLWARLDTEGIIARQVPPAQVKAFGRSRGTRAKTDTIDAELIARFLVLDPMQGADCLPKSCWFSDR